MSLKEKLQDFAGGFDAVRIKRLRNAAGVVCLVLAVFSLIAVVSYFFTWKADQSLAGDPGMMDSSVIAHNSGSKLGFRLGNFLVGKCFGFAAVGIITFLALLGTGLLFPGKVRDKLSKVVAGSLSATFLGSLLLAFISPLSGLEKLFGGGAGGQCGAAINSWSCNLIGIIPTGLSVLGLTALWLWLFFPGIFSPQAAAEEDDSEGQDYAPSPDPSYEPVYHPSYVPDYEPVYRPEPEPEPELEPELEPEPQPVEGDGGLEVITDDSLTAEVEQDLPRIDNRLDPPDGLPKYKFPPLDLLGSYESARRDVSPEELTRNNNKIRATLANYKIQVVDVKAIVGPTVTLYKVYPAPGVKIAAIRSLQDDIAMSLNARGVRVTTLSDSVGIEVANDVPSLVPLKSLLNDPEFRESKAELPVAIGYTITQKVKVFDLADAPHLLVAGATKQGKSVGLNVIVASLLYAKHPSELKFIFIDPKMVEFSAYGRLLKHYLAVLPNAASEQEEKDTAIVKNAKDASRILKSLCVEMDNRYELLNKAAVNNIKLYNDKFKDRKLRPDQGHRFMPYLVVVVDEYADLTMSVGAGPESKALARTITTSVIRLAQKGRAAGLHVILATQRPTVDVVTGLIKTNFPMRIAFRVTARVDSATILDSPGAEKLIGKGDMLLYSGIEMERVQCGFISNDEISALSSFVEDQQGYGKCYNTPYYLPEPEPDTPEEGGGGMVDMRQLDDRFEEAARLIVQTQRGSTSDIQRRLGMGYAKAGRVMDQLEAAGIVGPQEGSKPRQVLVKDFAELDELLKHFMKG